MDADSLVFAPDGDVILAVGEKKFRIRADSLFLKRHSKVFAALFGPNFREGQGLNTSYPKEIPFPEDDPYAMTAICAIMYHDFDHIPRSPTTDQFLSIIKHADKYDCCDVLTLPSQAYGWLKSDYLTLGKDLLNILAVSYLIRDQEGFKNTSKALVAKYGGSFADLADDVICDVLPWKTFCRLEELRTRIQSHAISIVAAAECKSYPHSGCSQLSAGIHKTNMITEMLRIQEEELRRAYRTGPRHPLVTRQSGVGPLLEILENLAKACGRCKENVEKSDLNTFCLSLAGNDLRQIAMLPEWYWGSKLTY